MLKLTPYNGSLVDDVQRTIAVQPSTIVLIDPNSKNESTYIDLVTGKRICVRETFEQIMDQWAKLSSQIEER